MTGAWGVAGRRGSPVGAEPATALRVWAAAAHVVASLPGPGRVELLALRPAGERTPSLRVEAYDAAALVAGGEVALWEINQAIAALLSASTQARRLSLRDDGGHGGYLDVVADGRDAEVVATSLDGRRRVVFGSPAEVFAADLGALVRHYLELARAPAAGRRTLVLPSAPGTAAVSPAPARR